MKKPFFKLLSSIILCIAVLLAFSMGIQNLTQKSHAEQKDTLEVSIWRSITQCYVIEGRYPQSLDYLRDEYGLSYETKNFFVDYQAIGENIPPEVVIIER